MKEIQSPGTPTYSEFVRRLFNRSGNPASDFTHAILGIVTEIHEYEFAKDAVNGLEELGDLRFYIVALRQVIEDLTGLPLPPTALPDLSTAKPAYPRGTVDDMSTALLDHAKRWIGYGKQPADLVSVFNTTATLAYFANITGPYPCGDYRRIEAVNMAKLLKRYPGGEFDAFRAVVRDLDGERAVLESAQ